MDEVTEAEHIIVKQLEDWKSQLNDVWNEMGNYIQCLEEDGSDVLVEAIKSYIKDVHIEQLSKQFLLVIEEMTEKIKAYTKGHCEIETNWKEGRIAQESLEEQQTALQEVSLDLIEETDKVEKTVNEVSDIIGQSMIPATLIEAGLRAVQARLEALKQVIGEYEEAHKESDFVTMEEQLNVLEEKVGKCCDEGEGIIKKYTSVREFSDEAVEMLKKLELEDYQLADTNVMIYDINNELIGMMPYYVMINGEVEGTFVDDGGITIGYGHHINVDEWANVNNEDHILIAQYIPEDVDITGIHADRDSLPRSGIIPVEGAEMVPIEVIEELLEQDIQIHSEEISGFINRNDEESDDTKERIILTQNEFDALVIYSYNRGSLSSKAKECLDEGRRIKEEWEKIWTGGENRKKYVRKYFSEEIIRMKKFYKGIVCIAVLGLIFVAGYFTCYSSLENAKNANVEDVQETADVQETVSVQEVEEVQETVEQDTEDMVVEDDSSIRERYRADNVATYRMFYGTWEFTEIVSEHLRLGGDEGYESLLGEKVTYLPDYFSCKGYGEVIEEIQNPKYQIYIFPLQERYNQFWPEQTGIEKLLPEAQFFVYVTIGARPFSKGGHGYCGIEFILKDESTMFAFDYNCIYKLERVSYIEEHEAGEYTRCRETWTE